MSGWLATWREGGQKEAARDICHGKDNLAGTWLLHSSHPLSMHRGLAGLSTSGIRSKQKHRHKTRLWLTEGATGLPWPPLGHGGIVHLDPPGAVLAAAQPHWGMSAVGHQPSRCFCIYFFSHFQGCQESLAHSKAPFPMWSYRAVASCAAGKIAFDSNENQQLNSSPFLAGQLGRFVPRQNRPFRAACFNLSSRSQDTESPRADTGAQARCI